MLSSKLKADIRRLWDAFWSGGIANPMTAIEQITYLVFLKRLEDLDRQRTDDARQAGREYTSIFDQKGGETYRWSYIKKLPSEERLGHVRGPVFDWLKTIEGAAERMRDAVFVIPSANLLQRAVEIIDTLFIPERNQDTLGDIYEMLLSEIAEAGKNGQFRTPRHIIRTMCDLVDPQFGDRICDPACGTSGFLVNAYQHILKSNTSPDILEFAADGTALNLIGDQLDAKQHEELRRNHLWGFDFDRTMVRLGWMNAIQHGLENPKVQYADTLGSHFNKQLLVNGGDIGDFDVVLANPPFTGSIDKSDIGESLRWLGTTKTELLFVELITQLLRIGGRAAVLVPEGLLFGSTRAHKALREKLIAQNQLNAVISLPGGVFQPYTGVKTSILVFAKGGHTDEAWFYEVEADGLKLSTTRTEQLDRNDLWDLTLKHRLRYARSFSQPAPAFMDGETWRQWEDTSSAQCSFQYLQPQIDTLPRLDLAAAGLGKEDTLQATLLTEFEIIDIEDAKDWTAPSIELAENDFNLSAGRYKPFSLEAVEYEPPDQIVRELQGLVKQMQAGLNKLLTLVEGGE